MMNDIPCKYLIILLISVHVFGEMYRMFERRALLNICYEFAEEAGKKGRISVRLKELEERTGAIESTSDVKSIDYVRKFLFGIGFYTDVKEGSKYLVFKSNHFNSIIVSIIIDDLRKRYFINVDLSLIWMILIMHVYLSFVYLYRMERMKDVDVYILDTLDTNTKYLPVS